MKAVVVCAALAAVSATACVGESDVALGTAGAAALVGGWTGYIENTTFPSGSDALTVQFTSGEGSEVTGTVVFGAGPMQPPPTDPDVGYPPQAESPQVGDVAEYASAEPREGFAYTIEQSNLTDARLRFRVNGLELFAAWCALQTPVLYDSAHAEYACLPKAETSNGNTCTIDSDGDASTPQVPLDCGKLVLCVLEPVCACDASGCTADTERGSLAFDLAVEADRAEGSMGSVRVRLFRQH